LGTLEDESAALSQREGSACEDEERQPKRARRTDAGICPVAEQLTHECEAASRPNDVHSQILWRSTRAKILARRGQLDAAERLGREAVAFASDSDFYPARAEALLDLAEVLEIAGDAVGATTAIQEAIRFYELKGNVLAAGRGHSLLEPQVERVS
jgi:D-alanyl-D-alanine carboxypeptidase